MSILELQLDFWIPPLLAALAGMFAALGFALSEAMKPRYPLDASGKEDKTKPPIEKPMVITKEELAEVGSLTLKGLSYGFLMGCILLGLLFVPALKDVLGFLFGEVFSVQCTVVTCFVVVIAISLGLHVKAWNEGGLFTTLFISVKTAGTNITEKLTDTAGKLTETVLDVATQKVNDVVDDVTTKATESIEEMQARLLAKQQEVEDLEQQVNEINSTEG